MSCRNNANLNILRFAKFRILFIEMAESWRSHLKCVMCRSDTCQWWMSLLVRGVRAERESALAYWEKRIYCFSCKCSRRHRERPLAFNLFTFDLSIIFMFDYVVSTKIFNHTNFVSMILSLVLMRVSMVEGNADTFSKRFERILFTTPARYNRRNARFDSPDAK